MSSLIHNDDEFARGDRELTLNIGAILGIFLGLVLLCGFFFGFGYKMGSHKSGPPIGAENTPSAAAVPPTTDFNAFKPPAGSPANTPSSRSSVTGRDAASESGPAAESSPAAVSPRSALAAEPPAPAHTPALAAVHLGTSSGTASGTSSATAATPAGSGSFIVQIAAVSLQEDANLLVGALRSKGYSVATHAEPDKLIHIQVGPFATRKEADAMRKRLLGDGYNAIVK